VGKRGCTENSDNSEQHGSLHCQPLYIQFDTRKMRDQDKDMPKIQETEKDITCPPQSTAYTLCKSPNLRQKEKIFLLTFTVSVS
jgi:hypothetical protein